jgi:hypothetical protein
VLVDHEAAWLALKAAVAQKSHHGQRDLLAEMARLEVAHALVEGLPEKALRLYGVDLSEDLLRPSSRVGRVLPSDGRNGRALRDGSTSESQEDAHAVGRGSR